jgi:uncharacterized protein YndB with AHSA1/START domain
MGDFKWSRFTVRINVNCPIDVLYKAWATQEGLEEWFLRLAEFRDSNGKIKGSSAFIEKGDIYRWMWHGWPDELAETSSILETNGKDYLKFNFGKAGDCSVTIKKEGKENIVELVQENIPDDEDGKREFHIGCKTGWTFYLANLKSMLEGGIDLRNKSLEVQKVINS